MAIATPSMSNNKDEDEDHHEHDMVMPGFRFHPTEEELVEFYLRRKVEGKRFNVELITFLDLYRYDPWELPGNYKKIKYKLSLFHKAKLYPYIYIIFILFLLHRLTACHGDPLLNSTKTSSLSAFPPFMHGGNSRLRHLLPGQLSCDSLCSSQDTYDGFLFLILLLLLLSFIAFLCCFEISVSLG